MVLEIRKATFVHNMDLIAQLAALSVQKREETFVEILNRHRLAEAVGCCDVDEFSEFFENEAAFRAAQVEAH